MSSGALPPFEAAERGLAGHLLCAVPQLQDPNFRRGVVLVVEHDEGGAWGLSLQQSLPVNMTQVAGSLGLTWKGDPSAQARLGGPVEATRGFVLHDQPEWDPVAHEVVPGLRLTTTLEQVIEVGHLEVGAVPARVLFLLGYAGWGPGQLENELAVGSWLAVPIGDPAGTLGVTVAWLFETPAAAIWEQALASMGIDPARVVGLGSGSRLSN